MTDAGRQLTWWRALIIVTGLLLVVLLPVARTDAHAISPIAGLSTIRNGTSIHVHMTQPGRYAMHVDASADVACFECDEVDNHGISDAAAHVAVLITSSDAMPDLAMATTVSPALSPDSLVLSPGFPPPQI